MHLKSLTAAFLTMALGLTANAGHSVFNLIFSGDQEVPGPGDTDGFGSGTLTVYPDGTIEWDFTYGNIGAPTGMHIHGPNGGVGQSAGVFEGLGIATTGGPNTLIGSKTTSTTNAAALLADPNDFYVNIHNSEFGGGALRSQVPEPGSAALLAVASAGLLVRRRRS